MPATGLAIATKLGIADFAANNLYRPKISLQFGASYLASQLAAFGGDPYRALAAYNAGPGAASDAADAAGSDDDLFVEELEFDETRLYVRLVMQNLALQAVIRGPRQAVVAAVKGHGQPTARKGFRGLHG